MGGKTSQSTSTVSIPPEVLARYNAVNARAEEVAQTPFQQYGGQFVAGLTPTQQAGVQNTNYAAGQAQPYYGAATGLALAGTMPVSPGGLQTSQYMNPFTQAVAAPTYQALRQQQGQERAQQQAQAIKSGAFGGDRAGLERANLARQQELGTAQAIAPIFQQGYQQALGTAQQQQGVNLAAEQANRAAFQQGAQQIAGLGTGAQQAALQGAQAQIAAGTQEQQTNQADLTARYQQFLQERGYPFQTAQFLANIAMGTGALSGSTTTSTQPAGFFSDERLKEDIHRVGETDDGLPIYSYRYKGDNKTQIGLIAQDVEKKKPEAVGLAPAADGHLYKTVDYKKATEHRPHREYGGGLDVNSMGGAVVPAMQGEGFAAGGYATSGFVNPFSTDEDSKKGSFSGSGPYGISLSTLAPGRLMVAQTPAPQQSGFAQAAQAGKNLTDLYKTGKAGLIGTAPTKEDPEGSSGLWGGQGKASGKNVFSELGDWLKPKTGAAHGGLIVGRHHYGSGGPTDGEDDNNDDANEDRAHVPSSAFPSDVLKAGAQHGSLATAGGRGGSGPQSGISQLGDAAKGISNIAGLFGEEGALSGVGEGAGDFFSSIFAAAVAHGGAINGPGLVVREHHADGKRVGTGLGETADLRDARDDERLMAMQSYGQKLPSFIPVSYDVEPGLNVRGQYLQQGQYSDIGGGLSIPVGRNRAELDGSYGWVRGAPQAQTQKSLMGRFVVPFADGGLVPRQHHAVGERVLAEAPGLVVADNSAPANYSDEADLPSPRAQEAMAVDAGLKAPLDVDSFLSYTSGKESANNPKAQAKTSSASGLYGFTDSTARTVLQRNPEIMERMQKEGISYDPRERGFVKTLPSHIQKDIATAHAKEQAKVLSDQGFEPTHANLRMNWFLGEAGGPSFLRKMQEDPNAPAYHAVRQDAVRANQSIFFKSDGTPRTMQEVFDLETKGRVGGGYSGGAPSKKEDNIGLSLKGIGDTVTSDKFLVPFLSFVGSTLASQRPTLGGALGEGIVGGVAGYQENKKVQAALAKGVLDIVKDRFNITTDPKTGQTIYFSKADGRTISPAQYAKAVGDLAEGMGVPRGVLGISTEGTEVRGPSGTTQPGQFTRPGEEAMRTGAPKKAEGETAEGAGAEKKKAEPEITDTRLMNPNQLFDHAIANKEKYKLIGDRDPDALLQEANEYKRIAASARIAGKDAEATAATQNAKDALDRRSQYVKDAISQEVENNKQLMQARNEDSKESYKAAQMREASYKADRALVIRTADILADYRAGRLSDARAGIADIASTLNIPLPSGFFNAAANDELIKSALTQVVAQVGERGLGRAPGTAIKTLEQTVANNKINPGASFALIGRTLGDLDKDHDRDVSYLKKGRGADYGEHILEWNEKTDPTDYYRRAYSSIPEPKGMDPTHRQSLIKTYKYEPKTRMSVEEGTRTSPGIVPEQAAPVQVRSLDEARRLPSGTVFTDPNGVVRRVP